MNWRQILLINLLNRRQRFDSDVRRLTLKDKDHSFKTLKKCDVIWYRPREKVVYDYAIRGTNMEKS